MISIDNMYYIEAYISTDDAEFELTFNCYQCFKDDLNFDNLLGLIDNGFACCWEADDVAYQIAEKTDNTNLKELFEYTGKNTDRTYSVFINVRDALKFIIENRAHYTDLTTQNIFDIIDGEDSNNYIYDFEHVKDILIVLKNELDLSMDEEGELPQLNRRL